MASSLPSQHHGLVLETVEKGFKVERLPTPAAVPGSAIVQVLYASVASYSREIYNGERNYPFPKPLVGGFSAVGRVAATGADATLLHPGQLVYVDSVVRGRDDSSAMFISAISDGWTEGSKKLMAGEWRNGTYAEYAKMPLENCIPLNEERLCKELGYKIPDLAYIGYLLVAYGGLRDINLQAGETVVISPATGGFGGAGVQVAVSMGARVIAMGRNEQELGRLRSYVNKGTPWGTVETVVITGDEETDTKSLQRFGVIDAVLDLSPPAAAKSTHLRSAIMALRQNGRVSLMGFMDLPFPSFKVIGSNIALKGKLMYEREDMLQFVKMMERGLFPKEHDFVETKVFEMEKWKEALDVAASHTGLGKQVVLAP